MFGLVLNFHAGCFVPHLHCIVTRCKCYKIFYTRFYAYCPILSRPCRHSSSRSVMCLMVISTIWISTSRGRHPSRSWNKLFELLHTFTKKEMIICYYPLFVRVPYNTRHSLTFLREPPQKVFKGVSQLACLPHSSTLSNASTSEKISKSSCGAPLLAPPR
jgi:hypothetical protein